MMNSIKFELIFFYKMADQNNIFLGVHVGKKNNINGDVRETLTTAIKQDIDAVGFNAAQIFTHGPRSYKQNKYNINEVLNTTADIHLSVHSAYFTTGIWKARAQAISLLKAQLAACREISAKYLIIHLTKTTPEAIADIMHAHILPMAQEYKITIALEMPACKVNKKSPNLTYETPEKLFNLTKTIGKHKYYGYCIDTAHLWGAGVNIKYYNDFANWLNVFDALYNGIYKTTNKQHKNKGRRRRRRTLIKMFHLNGSSAALGSGKDKHEIPGGTLDNIWRDVPFEQSGIKALIKYAMANKCPVINEINRGEPNDYNDYLKKINTLIKDVSMF